MTDRIFESSLHVQTEREFNVTSGSGAWRDRISHGSSEEVKEDLILSSVWRSTTMTIGIIAGCIGFTLLIMAVIGLVYVMLRRQRVQKLNPKSEKSYQIEAAKDQNKMDAALSA